MTETYDIVVIGAGPAGANFARLADSDHQKILVIYDDTREKPCGGLLSPDAQRVLASYDAVLPGEVLTSPQIFEEIRRLHDDFLKDSPLIKHNLSAFRTRYAYALLIEKDSTAAEQALAAFEKCAASYPHQTVAQTERAMTAHAQNLSKN